MFDLRAAVEPECGVGVAETNQNFLVLKSKYLNINFYYVCYAKLNSASPINV